MLLKSIATIIPVLMSVIATPTFMGDELASPVIDIRPPFAYYYYSE